MPSAGYSATRRRGVRVQVYRLTKTVTDRKKGDRQRYVTVHDVRLCVVTKSSYRALLAAQQTKRQIGEIVFLFYTKDVPFTELDAEDWVIYGGRKYRVVESVVDDCDCLRVSANYYRGSLPDEVNKSLVEQGLLSDAAS